MAGEDRTAHSLTQVFGLALMSVALLAVVTLTLVLFDGEDAGFFGTVALVAVIVTFLVWRFDSTWARVLGILGTLAVFAAVFFLAFGLLQVFSPIEFIVGMLLLVGFLLSIVGGIRAIIAGRKQRMAPRPGEARLRTGVIAVMSAAALISIVGFFFTKSTVSEAEAAGATTLEMFDFEFEPKQSSVPSGGKLLVVNSDPFAHDLTVNELDVAVHVGPGGEALVDLSGAAPGTYDYFCSLHSDGTEGMVGTITIEA